MPDTTGISAMGERLLGGMIARKLAEQGRKEMAMRVGLPILLDQQRSAQEHRYRMQEIAEKRQADMAMKEFELAHEKPEKLQAPKPFDMWVGGKQKQFVFDPNTGQITETSEIPQKGEKPETPTKTNMADISGATNLLLKPYELSKSSEAILNALNLVDEWQGFDKATKENLAENGDKTPYAPLAELWKKAPKEGGGFWGGGEKVEPSPEFYLRQLGVTPAEVEKASIEKAKYDLAQQASQQLPGLLSGTTEADAASIISNLHSQINAQIQQAVEAAKQQTQPEAAPEQVNPDADLDKQIMEALQRL